MAWKKGFKFVNAEVNSLSVVKIVNEQDFNVNASSSLVASIWQQLNKDWYVEVNHVYCETNFAVDWMPSFAATFPMGTHILQ